jgi:hypothetical protein
MRPMPYWTFLLETPGPTPVDHAGAGADLASAADFVPLGWLALFGCDDLCSVVPRGDASRHLTLITSAGHARARIEGRRALLADVLGPVLIEHVDLFAARLGGLPSERGIQVWMSDLVYRWPDDHDARGTLTRALRAIDARDPKGWDLLMELTHGERERASLRARFPRGLGVLSVVGRFRGRPVPDDADQIPPADADLEEADRRLTAQGVGLYAVHLGVREAARALLGPDPEDAAVDAVFEACWEGRMGMADAIEGSERALRRALLARLAWTDGRLDRLPREDDPELARASQLVALFCGALADVASRVLHDPDVRVRVALAFSYPPSSPDEDDDDDDAIAPHDEVWEALARDPDPRVRWAAHINPVSPLRPGDDPHPAIRALRADAPLLELLAIAGTDEPLGLATALCRRHTPMLVRREALRTMGLRS